MPLTITEFLEARIAEDETSLEAVPAAAKQLDDFDFGGTDDYLRFTMGYGRAVAECAAKRAIIEQCEQVLANPWDYGDATYTVEAALETLAAVYKGHPDYQQEWARG